MKDLTKGYPAKVILMFAIPLMCSSILQQLYNMVDSKIVSAYVGTAAFAAVGATSVVSNTLIGFINGLTQGFAILVANSFGAKDEKRMRQSVAGTLILTTVITVILTVLGLLLIRPILTMLRTPDDIMDNALSYVRIILAGIAFTALYNVFANILRAVGDSKTPLYCLTFAVILNVGLDLLFVAVLPWGIAGAAFATVIAQYVSGVGITIYVLHSCKDLLPGKEELCFDRGILGEIVNLSSLTCLQQSVMYFGILMVQGLVNSFGATVMAAFAAAVKIDTFAYLPVQDFGNAYSTFIAQNYGAGKKDRIRKGTKESFLLSFIFCIIISAIVCIFAAPLMTIFVSAKETAVITCGVQYLRIEGSFYCGIGCLFLPNYIHKPCKNSFFMLSLIIE